MAIIISKSEDVKQWLLRAKPQLKDADIGPDTDLIENRILDSVTFVNFVYFVEETTGKRFPLTSRETAEMFRTLRSIEEKILS